MKFSIIAVVIVSLGAYAAGDLCVDSTFEFKTESEEKVYCSELEDKALDCLQPTIMSHCKKSCEVSFCCADSQATFGVKLPGTKKPKYTTCDWKKLKKHCGMSGLKETCPVTCGTCNPIDELLQVITKQEEAIKEQVVINKDQGEIIAILEAEVNVYACGDYLYKPSAASETWSHHEAAAVAWGGHLASIHTVEENDCITSMITDLYHPTNFFIGLKRKVDELDQFEYIDGTTFDFKDWNVKTNEPNGIDDGENVVNLKWFKDGPKEAYHWNDATDSSKCGGVYKKLNPNL